MLGRAVWHGACPIHITCCWRFVPSRKTMIKLSIQIIICIVPYFTFYVNMDLLVVIWWVIDAPPSYAPHSSPAPHQWSLRNPGGRLYHPEPGPGESLGEKPGCQSCQTWIWDSGLTPTRYSSVDKCLNQQKALPPCQRGMNKRSDCSQLRQETAFKSQRTADDWLVFSLLSQNTRQKQFKNGLGLERWLCSEECEMRF